MTDGGPTHAEVHALVEDAADAVGDLWPLHSFVAANPLSGFEDRPFHEAVATGERLGGGRGYPEPSTFRRAWHEGRIDPDVLAEELDALGFDLGVEEALDEIEEATSTPAPSVDSDTRVDRLVTDWLSAFCDEGRAEAPMPHRDEGFYPAWRRVARHDPALPRAEVDGLPAEPETAVAEALADVPVDRRESVVVHHLAALPGWTGYVKRRAADNADWQREHPVDLVHLLAVRLATAELLDVDVVPEDDPLEDVEPAPPVEEAWLSAWERSQRDRLVDALASEAAKLDSDDVAADDGGRPDAQLAFCIDTRSEVVRRHVEAQGEYETHGYAGFFGVPIRYDAADREGAVDACPPMVEARHHVHDHPDPAEVERAERHDRRRAFVDAGYGLAETLETNVATAFSYVELAGVGYGAVMTALTLVPGWMRSAALRVGAAAERARCYSLDLDRKPEDDTDLPAGMTVDERVEYAATAFDLMGWDYFARLAVFVGHASETSNNPFDSALDCGACAGNPGGPNARVLAEICNDPEVRDRLRGRGIEIPGDTVFVAAEHNTTTDEIELYDGRVPESHENEVETLKRDLAAAREEAAAERASGMRGVEVDRAATATEVRAADWAQTRPEWGLAGNAAFVVGPRALTEEFDLGGRCFLHSYDWRSDDGDALKQILAGPAVVTHWINSQYYFAAVDNDAYGSGSKVTQNPTGNIGVRQGNGGDLETGLPLQSVAAADDEAYHQPLRLAVVVHAPRDRVAQALAEVEELRRPLDNGWLRLSVVDPTDTEVYHYAGDLGWREHAAAARTPSIAADD
ncbi:MAG: DUF2309 domain-containing protein [Halobacteriales archaeon]